MYEQHNTRAAIQSKLGTAASFASAATTYSAVVSLAPPVATGT